MSVRRRVGRTPELLERVLSGRKSRLSKYIAWVSRKYIREQGVE